MRTVSWYSAGLTISQEYERNVIKKFEVLGLSVCDISSLIDLSPDHQVCLSVRHEKLANNKLRNFDRILVPQYSKSCCQEVSKWTFFSTSMDQLKQSDMSSMNKIRVQTKTREYLWHSMIDHCRCNSLFSQPEVREVRMVGILLRRHFRVGL